MKIPFFFVPGYSSGSKTFSAKTTVINLIFRFRYHQIKSSGKIMRQEDIYNSQNVKKINNEQVDQIIKSIIAGKYSWACVLLLRYSGYNPIDYIPYRTYIRLIKNNCLGGGENQDSSSNQEVLI